MHPADPPRLPAFLRGIAEPALALVGATAVVLILTVPFVPTRLQLDHPLRPLPAGRSVGHEELERRVAELALADEVRVLLVGGSSRLVLSGVARPDAAEVAVRDVLERSGYQRDDFVRTEVTHMEGLLQAEAGRLPIVMSIQAAVFLLGGMWLARGRLGDSVSPCVTSRGRAVAIGLGAGVGAVILSAGLGAGLEYLGFPVEEQAWLVELLADPAALARVAPWVVLIAPVSEEVFFRFYVFRFITLHAGFPAGLVASSLMFALIHMNLTGLLIYLGIGCLLGWAYHRTGRLVAPIVGHATLNVIVLIAASLTSQAEP